MNFEKIEHLSIGTLKLRLIFIFFNMKIHIFFLTISIHVPTYYRGMTGSVTCED